jgi:tRNA G18 (ribose-2'-O)-methylase SpoU
MTLIPIDALDDSRLDCYRDLNQRNLTRQSGLFIAEGDKVVDRLVASRFEIVSILAEPAFAEKYALRVSSNVQIFVASRERMEQVAGFHFHRGILACGRRQRLACLDDLPHPTDITNLRSTIVACPDVQDPTNLGSIIRVAAAFGCSAVILGHECADPFSRRVLRVSMGTALHIPIIESGELAADMRALKAVDFEVVAAVVDATAEPLAQTRRRGRVALMFGSEGHGLSAEWLAHADRQVTIPMQLGIDSLNVAISAAVFLYHFCQ